MFASERVRDGDVDLRTVEGSIALVDLPSGTAGGGEGVQGMAQLILGRRPGLDLT